MSTIKDKLYFNFDGINSKSFDLVHVELSNGMFEESLIADRTIVETKMRNNDRPIFNRVEEAPLSFQLNLAFIGKYTDEKLSAVINWLFKDYYRPLYFEGQEDRIYMCIAEGNSSITHNGLKEGYVTLTMRCDSPRKYSPLITTNKTTVTNSSPKVINIMNDGSDEVSTEISIQKVGAGSVTIKTSEGTVKVDNLKDKEDIYINSWKEIIETNLNNVYRYDDVTGDLLYLMLKRGNNQFTVTGGCTIQIRYRLQYRN